MRRIALLGIIVIFMLFSLSPYIAKASSDLQFYFGNLHAHTSYSDGMGTPTEAYSQVSSAGAMDFLSLTEHGYYFQEITNIHLWYKSIEEADLFYKEGKFVSLVGYEWTHAEGHMNGYGTPKAASRDTQRDFTSFIEYLHEFGGIASLNHPNPEIQPNWNDFSYWSYADEVVSMIEVGSGAYYRNTRNEPSYIKALDRGWKIGAVNNQDNHRDDWSRAAEVRTGIVAFELTRKSIMDAMRNMRTYSTEDRNARALITSGKYIMGDTIVTNTSLVGQKFSFDIYVEDPDKEAYTSIKLITNGGRVAASIGSVPGGTYSFTVEPTLDYNYYYAKIIQADGDTIITTPIWVESGSGLVVSDAKMEDVFITKGRQATFYARIADRNGKGNLEVPYELLADYGKGYVKVASGKVAIASGRWEHLLIPWVPDDKGEVAMKLVLDSQAGAQQYFAGAYEVLEHEPLGFAIDEAHNNRLTSYYGTLIKLARTFGYEGRIIEEIITPASLEGLRVLIIPLPEQGFALKPTYYEDTELKAIADWVGEGGSLLLLGWGDIGDGTRDVKDFNALLDLIGGGLKFEPAIITSSGSPIKSALLKVPSGDHKIYITEAGSIVVEEASLSSMSFIARLDGTKAEISGGDIYERPVFAASKPAGKGKVMIIGSVPFSDYEIGKAGYDNAALTKTILRWLFEGRW